MIYRPQLESFSDDERTRVMTRSSTPPPLPPHARRMAPPPPPTPKQKAAAVAKPIRCYPPKPSMDEPTKSAFHAPPSSRHAMPTIPPAPLVPADMAVTHAVGPISQSSTPPSPTSTSDLPPAVITSSMKISLGRPTPSWAAALVALGVFAGLVTAVLARGDGDALIHAGAQLVDPTHHAAAAQAAVAAPMLPQPTAVIATPIANPTPMTPVAVKAACAEDKDPPKVDAKEPVTVKVDAPAPVAVKAAPPPVVKTVVAPPPVVVQPKTVVTTKAAPPPPKTDAVAAAPKPAAKAAKPATDDASAADALAKAQLEAALGR